MNNQEILHNSFVSELEKHYGPFNKTNNKFKSTSNSKIARDLFYSDSQFSRLINNTASEGELTRALENVKRLLEVSALRSQLKNKSEVVPKATPKRNLKLFLGIVCIIAAFVLGSIYLFKNSKIKQVVTTENSRYNMLKWSFENNYVKPYITLRELPDDCYYPCYKYQGKWELKEAYKIPFFRERNGFHYVATEAVMYATCSDKTSGNGESFDGYEYQKHEIWYDKREYPIDSLCILFLRPFLK